MLSFERIIQFALQAHEGQMDKEGDPFILHPMHVMMKMSSCEERIVAILHDVVEDTDYTFDDLRSKLGLTDEIIDALDCLTRRKSETYKQMVERIKQNELATRVKVADLEHNMDLKRIKNRRNLKKTDMKRLQNYITAWTYLTGF